MSDGLFFSRFSLGSSSSSSGSASYSRTSSLSLSSFRLSLPEPLSTEASGELKGLPRGVDLFSDDGSGVEGEDGDDEWEEKSIGLVWRNSYVAPRPHKNGGGSGIGVIDLDTSREGSLVMVEGEDDDDGDDNEEESVDDAEQKKKKKQQLQQLQQQPRNVAFNREMKALARDQEKRMTAVVSMLNFLYKAVKKRSAKAVAATTKGTPAQAQSKAREEVLENLFNTTYDDLKYLEVLKELLQSDNGTTHDCTRTTAHAHTHHRTHDRTRSTSSAGADQLVREDTIEEIMVGKFKGAEELGLPLSLFCALKTAHQGASSRTSL
jgi:hypothetical protein